MPPAFDLPVAPRAWREGTGQAQSWDKEQPVRHAGFVCPRETPVAPRAPPQGGGLPPALRHFLFLTIPCALHGRCGGHIRASAVLTQGAIGRHKTPNSRLPHAQSNRLKARSGKQVPATWGKEKNMAGILVIQ